MPLASKVKSLSIKNGPNLDAFSRLRTSDPVTIFDSQSEYGDSDLFWDSVAAGTGTMSNLLDESAVLLSTGGTASGASMIRQTRIYHKYQPGHSQMILTTFKMSDPYDNVVSEIGYNDGNNGILLQRSGTTVSFVRRTYTSGAAIDNAIEQSEWNLDKMDGSGPSQLTLDLTKTQILIIDLQWLGVGRVRVGFDIDGIIYYAHEFKHANILTTPYMSTANLPIRVRVYNDGIATGTGTIKHICSSVISEGGFEDKRGLQFAVNTGTSLVGVTTRVPILTLRAKTTGPNSVVNTGQIIIKNFDAIATSNPSLVEIVLHGTLTSPSFAAVNASYSLAEVDVAATAISGGIVIESFYLPAGNANKPGGAQRDPFSTIPILYSSLTNTQDVISVVATSLSGTSDVACSMTWQEYY